MDNAGSNPVRGAKATYTPHTAEYQRQRYRRWRDNVISTLGGVCTRCGSDQEIQLDHQDASKKSFDISKLWSSTSRLRKELEKIQLLCKPCHQRKTTEERTVGHGGGLTGVRNCRCELCAPLKEAYMTSRRYNSDRCRRANCPRDCGRRRHY